LDYETVLIVDGMLDDPTIEAQIAKAEEFIRSKGELKNTTRLGKRRMAYTIKKKNYGYYVVFTYRGDGKLVSDMEQIFRYDEQVVRYLTTRA